MIADLVRTNLDIMYAKCIDEAVGEIEGELVKKEVDGYLERLYEAVAEEEERELR